MSAEGHFGLQGIMSVNGKPIFQGISSYGGTNTIAFTSETISGFGSQNQMHLQGMWKYSGDETTDAPYKGITGVSINGNVYPGDLSIKENIPKDNSPSEKTQTKSLSFDGTNYVAQYVPSSPFELQKGADISQVQKGVPLVLQSYDAAVQAAVSKTGGSLDQFKLGYVLALADPKNAILDSPDLFSSYAHDFLTSPQKYSFQISPLGSVVVDAQGAIVHLLPAVDSVSGKTNSRNGNNNDNNKNNNKNNGETANGNGAGEKSTLEASGNGYTISPSFYVTESAYEGGVAATLPNYHLIDGKVSLVLDGNIGLDYVLPKGDLSNFDLTTKLNPGVSILFPDGHVRLSTELETALLNGASEFSFKNIKTTAEVGATVYGISPSVGYTISYSPDKNLVHTLEFGAEYNLHSVGLPLGVSATYSLDLNKPESPEGVTFGGNKEGNVNVHVFYTSK